MSFEEFIRIIKEKIKSRLGDEYTVEIEPITINNNTERTMLCMRKNDDKWNYSICLERYFDKMQSEEIEWEALIDDILFAYTKAKFEYNYDITTFLEWDKVKENIYYKLVNTERNKALLLDVPSRAFNDLSIVYYVFVETEFSYGLTGSIVIRNTHMNLWSVDEKTLYEVASKNMKEKEEAVFQNIISFIDDIVGEEYAKEFDNDFPMYVLHNRHRMFGAVRMIDLDILEQIGKKLDSDFIVLPSSVHEVIILPISMVKDLDDAVKMVKEINMTMVKREEILSDHVYRFSQDKRKLEIVA